MIYGTYLVKGHHLFTDTHLLHNHNECYEKYFLQDEALEETGWKLIHGDVFRPPLYPSILVACLGSGIQIFCMVLIIIGT